MYSYFFVSHSVNQTDTHHSVSFGSQVRVTTDGASRDSSSSAKNPPRPDVDQSSDKAIV